MGVFLLNICRNDYYNILTLIFGNFWWHLEISGIWKLRIGKSGNSQKLASFGQFQYIGYFSHSVLVTDLDFQLRISNFQLFWNLEIGNLEIPGNWLVLANVNILAIFPTQFRSLTLIFNSEFQISNFSGIWKLEIWKLLEIPDSRKIGNLKF